MDYSALIGAASAALVLVVGKAIEWTRARRQANLEEAKQKGEDRRADERAHAEVTIPVNEQAVRIYKDIIDGLRQDMQKINHGMEEQEKAYIAAREENVELKVKLEHKELETESLRARVAELESKLALLEKKA